MHCCVRFPDGDDDPVDRHVRNPASVDEPVVAATILMVEDNAEAARLRPGTPVLLTTGWADRTRDHASQPPERDLIAKPYRQATLLRKIRLLLDRGAEGV